MTLEPGWLGAVRESVAEYMRDCAGFTEDENGMTNTKSNNEPRDPVFEAFIRGERDKLGTSVRGDSGEKGMTETEKVVPASAGGMDGYRDALNQKNERIAALEAQNAELKNALMVSEQFRRAYADGKYKLYSMGGEICEAASEHLPCSEGPLGRYTAKIEREHSPKLLEDRNYLASELQKAEAQNADQLRHIKELLLEIGTMRENATALVNAGDGMAALFKMALADEDEFDHEEYELLRAAWTRAKGGRL